MATTDQWMAKCEEWAQRLRDDAGGNIPNGLHAIVDDLADRYGAATVAEAANEANRIWHGAAYELATWANQLVAVARAVHAEAASLQPNAYRLQLLDNLERRCEKVSELAQRFTNDVEG